jgi:hypothetical protein
MSFGDVSQYSRTSGFDEEHVDPHGECAAEIHRLQAKNAALKAEVAQLRTVVEMTDRHFARNGYPEIHDARKILRAVLSTSQEQGR